MTFRDRHDAGVQLALRLQKYRNQQDSWVLGLARGGIVVAYEVAKALGLPLGPLVIRKIRAPGNEELGIGAISEDGELILNEHLISVLGVSSDYLKREVEQQKKNAKARGDLYRAGSSSLVLKGKTAILVDDGIATGASVRVAIKSLRANGVKKIVLAAPVAAQDSLKEISKEVEETVCLSVPVFFEAVGSFYESFPQISDEEVMRLLDLLCN